MKIRWLVIWGLLTAAIIWSRGWTAEPVSTEVCRIEMLWLPQAEFAGFYVAEAEGLYEKAGVNVELVHPRPDEDIFDTLQKKRVDMVVAWLGSALDRVKNGDDLVSVAQPHRSSALMLIARRGSGLRAPADISGRRVGMWIAPSLRTPIRRYFEHHKIRNCRILPVLTTVDLLLYGGVDVTAGVEYDEYYRLYMAGIDFEDLTVFRLRDTFPALADDGLFCRREFQARRAEDCRKIRAATMAGWRRAFRDKKRTLEIVREVCAKHRIPFNSAHQRWMLDVMENLVFPAGPDAYDGILERGAYEQALEMNGLSREFMTYEHFVPEAGD